MIIMDEMNGDPPEIRIHRKFFEDRVAQANKREKHFKKMKAQRKARKISRKR